MDGSQLFLHFKTKRVFHEFQTKNPVSVALTLSVREKCLGPQGEKEVFHDCLLRDVGTLYTVCRRNMCAVHVCGNLPSSAVVIVSYS